MPAARSFRLPDELVADLQDRARQDGVSHTELVTSLLDEGLKIREFPGIVFRDGPAGRRAALAAGPDVWEVVATLRHVAGSGEERIRNASTMLSLEARWVRLAVEYYAAHPDEVDERIAANDAAATRLRGRAARREQLLA